jgi:hypothetical protein
MPGWAWRVPLQRLKRCRVHRAGLELSAFSRLFPSLVGPACSSARVQAEVSGFARAGEGVDGGSGLERSGPLASTRLMRAVLKGDHRRGSGPVDCAPGAAPAAPANRRRFPAKPTISHGRGSHQPAGQRGALLGWRSLGGRGLSPLGSGCRPDRSTAFSARGFAELVRHLLISRR